jgi:hypothetical protein
MPRYPRSLDSLKFNNRFKIPFSRFKMLPPKLREIHILNLAGRASIFAQGKT